MTCDVGRLAAKADIVSIRRGLYEIFHPVIVLGCFMVEKGECRDVQ